MIKKKIKHWLLCWGYAKTISKNSGVFQIMTGIIKFMQDTHEAQKPMLTKIEIVNMVDGEPEHLTDLVSLWAGIGDANPIERIKVLVAQRDVLKLLLGKLHAGTATDSEKREIEIHLKFME